MPIQFRCNYCNQLLSIATRKAGAVVNCPTCAARIIVPRRSEPAKVGAPAKAEGAKTKNGAGKDDDASLLEHGDFEELLKAPEPLHDRPEPVPAPNAEKTGKAPSRSNSSSAEVSPGQEINVELVAALPVTGTALVLTPGRASILAVAAVVLLTLAFLIGLWIGRMG